MARIAIWCFLAAQATATLASSGLNIKRAVSFFDPNAGGGSMLDSVGGDLGEPLNVSLNSQSIRLA